MLCPPKLTAGGLLLVPVALAAEGLPASLSPTEVAGYGYLSLVGTLLAYTIWFWGLERRRSPCSGCSLPSWRP